MKAEFIQKFKDAKNDRERWELVFSNSENVNKIQIDNDDIFIPIDEDSVLQFDNFGYDSVKDILDAIGVKSDFV